MVRHEAIAPHLHPMHSAVLGENVSINRIVIVNQENALATITPLRDVVRIVRNDDPGETSHSASIAIN